MSIKEGDRVYNGEVNDFGIVSRVYDDIGIAIVEHGGPGCKITLKARLFNLTKCPEKKEEPKKKSFLEKMKDNFLRRSYD